MTLSEREALREHARALCAYAVAFGQAKVEPAAEVHMRAHGRGRMLSLEEFRAEAGARLNESDDRLHALGMR